MTRNKGESRVISSFSEFYSFYQDQHRKKGTRILHLLGSLSFVAVAITATVARQTKLLPLGVVAGYGCAWIGHFFVERNRPATITYPLWSLMADFKMLFNILTRKEPLDAAALPLKSTGE